LEEVFCNVLATGQAQADAVILLLLLYYMWIQKEFTLKSRARGCYLITDEVLQHVSKELQQIDIGVAHVFLKHSSAGICLNENADSTVRRDMEKILNKVVPEGQGLYQHDSEGPDDMPAHGKCALVGSSLSIPITKGELNLGTWQGIWLLEFRTHQHTRSLVVTLNGSKA
jgi:secondary thiamine-phosphate synthase enzyme